MDDKTPENCPLCGALPCDWTDDPHKKETSLLFVLADIRAAMGVMEKPMLSELAGIIADRWFKPIKDAPRDGSHIYVYVDGAGLVHAFWDKNDAHPNGFWRSAATGKRCGHHAEWFISFDQMTPDNKKHLLYQQHNGA